MSLIPIYDPYSANLYANNLGMFRNRIINGDMRIDQRGSASTPVTSAGYAMDRFRVGANLTSGTFAFSQSNLPSPLPGFTKCAKLVGTSINVSGAGNAFYVNQLIEGYNIADLGWGATGAVPVTITFWIYCTSTGTFSIALRNGDTTRSYVSNFTISAANTWQQVSFTAPGDTTGTWATDNTIGMYLTFGFGIGTTFQTTAGSWQTGNYYGTTSTSSLGSSTVYITGVQLEKGIIATPFEFRPYGMELQLCQRYYEILTLPTNNNYQIIITPIVGGTSYMGTILGYFQTQKRTTAVTSVKYLFTDATYSTTLATGKWCFGNGANVQARSGTISAIGICNCFGVALGPASFAQTCIYFLFHGSDAGKTIMDADAEL